MAGLPEYTMDEVAKHKGPGGTGVWFVYQGKIYDVSKSDLWVDGDHQGMHSAGRDITARWRTHRTTRMSSRGMRRLGYSRSDQ